VGLIGAWAMALQALPLDSVTARECVRGDCQNGQGTLELKTEFGKGFYRGEFLGGEFHGKGRLEIPVSFLEKSIYVGDWDEGIRSGRGTYWNGDGKLYIGEWRDDKRNGHGSYFFGLPRWEENKPRTTPGTSSMTITKARALTVGPTASGMRAAFLRARSTALGRFSTPQAPVAIRFGNTANS
jgi:hypothetical protein